MATRTLVSWLEEHRAVFRLKFDKKDGYVLKLRTPEDHPILFIPPERKFPTTYWKILPNLQEDLSLPLVEFLNSAAAGEVGCVQDEVVKRRELAYPWFGTDEYITHKREQFVEAVKVDILSLVDPRERTEAVMARLEHATNNQSTYPLPEDFIAYVPKPELMLCEMLPAIPPQLPLSDAWVVDVFKLLRKPQLHVQEPQVEPLETGLELI